jgi:hypothetical protein
LKKLLYLLPLFSSILLAEAQIYFGTGYTYNSESVSGINKTFQSNGARIKIGYGDISAYAIELSLDYIDNKQEIFDNSDTYKVGFNVELLKAFDFNLFFNPFVKAGFGAGYLKTNADVVNQSLTYGNWNLGTGLFIPLNKHIDFEIAYEYKSISYQKLDPALINNPTASINIGYIGINFRY